MNFKVENDCIIFQFQEEELTQNIKSIFSKVSADIQFKNGVAVIQHKDIADMNIHEIKTLGLPPVYPYRLVFKPKGRPATPAFSFEIEFIGPQSRKFYQKKRTGVILNLDEERFTLTNPHFIFLERLKKLSAEIKSPGERLELWSKVVEIAPKEAVLDNKELLDFQFIKADRFCLDQKTSGKELKIVPELIYRKINSEDTDFSIQLPEGISLEFKEIFLKTRSVDPYYKTGNYYIQLSKPLKDCLKIIKKINKEPLEKRHAFYLNPMERIKNELPEDLSENFLEDIFFETDHFKSDRISHLGKWIPKIGIYIDPDSKNPWFPKDHIAIRIGDSLFHFNPDNLIDVVEKLEQAKKEGRDIFCYESQSIPVNDKTISEIKKVIDQITRRARPPKDPPNRPKPPLSEMVAVIKDNIDELVYERDTKNPLQLKKSIPRNLEEKFINYPYQKEGVLWLEENFIKRSPGALLADDMGLGKTIQALVFLYWYKQNIKEKKPILIVAPTGLLQNWQDEHERHLLTHGGLGRKYKAYGESFRIDRKTGTILSIVEKMKRSDWVLTTYEAVRDHHKDFFIKISWGVVVFDEIQKIKNPNALMTDAAKALDSDFSIGLTGTPIENSFIDLWCVTDSLYPKLLGLLKDFHKKYIKNKPDNPGREIQNNLSNKRPPFILRRIKEDILNNLPKRKIISIKENMTNEQKDAYSEVIRKARNREYSSFLESLSLLKRYSIYGADNSEGTDEDFIQSSAKLKILFKELEKIKSKNEKVLICIENRMLQKKLKGICDSKWNLAVNIINGDMPGDRRKKVVDRFGREEGFNVMIIAPRAGGIGLNIVSANHIIHLERWWNPAVEDQSNDRIFRIGQKRSVFVYNLLAVHPDYREESFDVVLDKLLERKRNIRRQTLIPSEPDDHEKGDIYRGVTGGEEPYISVKESFYNSLEWKVLREKVLQKYPPVCMRCKNKQNLEVDHIKPRSKYPDLELEFKNLQILCRDCNLMKGVKDSPEWDFRNQ